jgi:Tfp pilus assembly protein PilN
MRAVNLIPVDERSGADRSGGAVYILLGILGALVLFTVAWVLVNNQVTSKQSNLEQLRADTTAAQQQAAALAPFRTFASMREKRVETVKSLADSRFAWGPVLRKMSMVLPRDVWLTSMVGTVAPGVSIEGQGGGGGDTSALRAALPVPAVELQGCTSSQAEVARVLTRLRLIDGVVRVSLASSKKSDKGTVGSQQPSESDTSTGPAAGAGAGSSDCRGGKDIPQFSIVVFFNPVTGASAVPAVGGATPTPAGNTTTTPAGGAQPGATQPTSGSGGGTP